jgi:hypothetical protein
VYLALIPPLAWITPLALLAAAVQLTAAYEYYTMQWLSRSLQARTGSQPRNQSFAQMDKR